MKQKAIHGSWLCATLLFAYGCPARHADFRPVEAAQAFEAGQAAVYYEVEVDGRNLGDIRIWSPGAYRAEMNGRERALHVQLRMRNDSDTPLTLDLQNTYVEIATEGMVWLVEREETRVEGRPEVAPGATERVHLYYRLPEGTRPRDVTAFELNWRVSTPLGAVTESTPFTRDRRERDQWRWAPAPYYGFGRGFYHGGFGPRYWYW